MATVQQNVYNVGGVMMARPFKLRRLGHFGINVDRMEECYHFYHDLLGFKWSDDIDFGTRPALTEFLRGVTLTKGHFFHHGTDHHSFVLFPKPTMDRLAAAGERGSVGDGDMTINQITWQTGSLAEVVEAPKYFDQHGVTIMRSGRDMPGSNWHTYVYDPDGHVDGLYYGIEQIGWNGRSKPLPMYERGFAEAPSLPQIGEAVEVEEAMAKGVDLASGTRDVEQAPGRYEVGGVLLARPFKITKIGPVSLFVKDFERSLAFYVDELGFVVTEETAVNGRRAVFLRNGTEHHSMVLLPKELRAELGFSSHTTLASFGLELGSYQQLRDALAFLKENGVTVVDVPDELHPGIDYAAYAIDPDGHRMLLYYYMEQVGWDGRTRSAEQRRGPVGTMDTWPDALESLTDTYADQVFQGPLA